MFRNFNKIKRTGDNQGDSYLYFVAIAIVLSVVSFSILLDNFKSYRSEVSVILIPKSEKAALDSEHIIQNLKFFPTELSFYDKLIRDNSDIEDIYSGLSDNKRKELWNNSLHAKREKNSSIIEISVTRNNQEDAENISQAAAFTLFNTASFYYNIKDDVDFRIIDGPIVHSSVGNWPLLIALSLLMGIVASFIVNLFSYHLSYYFLRRKERIKFQSEMKVFEKKPEFEQPMKKEAVKIPELETPLDKTFEKKSSAPENLPFVDEDYFQNNIIKANGFSIEESEVEEESIPEKITEDQPVPAADFHREPTEEELKKRLNQLLRGEL
jgi:capsular polysaccharide biosynthesis protein